MMKIVKDIYPNKGQFLINDRIEIVIELMEKNLDLFDKLHLEITNMDNVLYMKDYNIDQLHIDKNKEIIIRVPSLNVGGYGVELSAYVDDEIIQIINTAFDVAKTHKELPRYGFLSDFTKDDELDYSDILSMKKLHINLVQFYDWMYRHESLVSEENEYVDLMGKTMTKAAVTNKINMCHKHGMKAIAYGAVYAASKAFYDKHKTWGLNDSSGKPITFIDLFYIMNVSEDSLWHKHIINEYKATIEKLNFDGIHMDTYGFPKKGYSNIEEQSKVIEMDKAFQPLINHTKDQLSEVKEDVTIIFNNVGNWPVYSTANTKQDMIYVEVWEPYSTYEHIQRIIKEARCFTDKPIIISAYLKPFMNTKHEEAGYSLKLMTACVVANGANHLIMGENQGVLTQGYYVDYYKLDDKLYGDIRKYYDFMIRYSELFYDKTLVDVSMTHAYGDNKEYVFKGVSCSPTAEPNKLWTVIRENQETKLISIINLKGNDHLWNESKVKPEVINELTLEIQIEKEVEQVFITSPNKQSLISVPYTVIVGERGKVLTMDLEDLDIWTVVVIRLC